ncbi:hypothetical protein N8517_00025 [Synechococcus sp. AH-601-L23]|nr:hypothetical protein [Synechococcus sp. AH-601-L23]
MNSPENNNFETKAVDLGINLNDENHIKSLWNQYCSKIKDFEIQLSTTDDSIDEDLTAADENAEQLLCDTEIIKDIFNSLKQEQSLEPKCSNTDQIAWLQKKITDLDHIKGELELKLRNASINPQNS